MPMLYLNNRIEHSNMVPIDYTTRYEALSKKQKGFIRREFHKWCGWGSTTMYRKLSGTNLTLLENMMIDQLLQAIEASNNEQLMIQFRWDKQNGPIMETSLFGNAK